MGLGFGEALQRAVALEARVLLVQVTAVHHDREGLDLAVAGVGAEVVAAHGEAAVRLAEARLLDHRARSLRVAGRVNLGAAVGLHLVRARARVGDRVS